ncbi:MAG TPA: lipase maturation factor family protein [bacterium]|nr:lipase maturation factor family protein [bacterium]
MNPTTDRPLLVFDGDCRFCRRWIERWRYWTKNLVADMPSQDAGKHLPDIPPEKFQGTVVLVEPDGRSSFGAEAVFRSLAYVPSKRWMLWAYLRIPGLRPFTEGIYRLIARHRIFFSKVTDFLWGNDLKPSTYEISGRLFLKALGIIYLVAFLSLGVQINGLIGSNGILPVSQYLAAIARQTSADRYWLLPTLVWFNQSDVFLAILWQGGIVASLLLILNVMPAAAAFVAWLFYLSLVHAGQQFMSFQWDILLLETGFLAVFLSPLHLIPGFPRSRLPGKGPVVWLFRWLLFRLMFSSGVVKLSSGDPVWHNLTALFYHYETQPLPTWIGWYAHQLPPWFQKFSCAMMFFIELVIPFFIFMPRRLRLTACVSLIGFQVLILLTGNYCFFNLIAMALCLFLVDDAVWPSFMRHGMAGNAEESGSPAARRFFQWPKWVIYPLTAIIFLASFVPLSGIFRKRLLMPFPIIFLYDVLQPFNIVNGYGLFAVMTTSRPEIIIEGSQDGLDWEAYEFKWKPGEIMKRPGFVEPHQPRLDWQMWFAALSDYRRHPWFLNFIARLIQGKEEVLQLLERNPFPDNPPQMIRAVVYDYHFTDPAARRENGAWWTRKRRNLYAPVLERKDDKILFSG